MKITKNNKKLLKNIDTSVVYEPIEAIKILKSNKIQTNQKHKEEWVT